MTKKKNVAIAKQGGRYVVRDLDNRTATKPLYVMLTDEQKATYEAAAKASGMSMREYVVSALDRQVADQELEIEPQPDGTTIVTETVRNVDPRVPALLLRVGTLEKQMAALQRRVETRWGHDMGPLDGVFDKNR